MKKWLVLGLLGILSLGVYAADISDTVNTLNGQLYNKAYRSVNDGTNAETSDNVSANLFKNCFAATNTVKATGGYIDQFTINQGCQSGSYVLADAAAGAASYATVISTYAASTTGPFPIVVTVHARTSNGIAFSVPFATCTVTVSYR